MNSYALRLLVFLLAATPAWAKDDAEKLPKQPARQAQEIQVPIPINAMNVDTQLNLLRDPKVQGELKITETQKNQVEKAAAKVKGMLRQLYRGNGANRVEATRESTKRRIEIAEGVIGGLKPEQIKRLREISIQISGRWAFRDDDVAKRLQMTEEQRAKVAEIDKNERSLRRQLRTDFRNGTVPPSKYVQKGEELKKDASEKILEVLTEKQRAAFDMMKGEKFELPRRTMRIRPAGIQERPTQRDSSRS